MGKEIPAQRQAEPQHPVAPPGWSPAVASPASDPSGLAPIPRQGGPTIETGYADLVQASVGGTASKPAVTATPTQPQIDKPVAAVSMPGFVDNDDGANIRNRPAELPGSVMLTTAPLPPTTRVFVSGHHPNTAEWSYVTAIVPGAGLFRGYVQKHRVAIDLPEPTAKLYQIKPGDTAEGLAVREYASAVRDGHDLRYYENALLYINRNHGRAGVRGSYQDPSLFGGGGNNVQLEAGRRIWLVSPAYAKALEKIVPDGSLTNGAYAKVRRFAGHIEDLVSSVTDSPKYFGEVAGEYKKAILDNLTEIIGITAGFILAEVVSVSLAASPTGVGQLAAVIIQLALAAFGAKGMLDAGSQALDHGGNWLTLAWNANGDAKQLAAASKEFLKMLVSIAMAAMAFLGVKGNLGKGLKIADAITIQPPQLTFMPPMATPQGTLVAGGPIFTPGAITTTGPVAISPSVLSGLGPASGSLSKMVGHGGGSSTKGAAAGTKGSPTKQPAAAESWIRPKNWRLPKNGTWSGTPGDSIFTPANPKHLGLKPGQKITFKQGLPDFSPYATDKFEVPGLTGVHAVDMPIIHQEAALRYGLPSPNAAKSWLSRMGLTPHHAGGNSVELVPTQLHDGVRHSGGAVLLRGP